VSPDTFLFFFSPFPPAPTWVIMEQRGRERNGQRSRGATFQGARLPPPLFFFPPPLRTLGGQTGRQGKAVGSRLPGVRAACYFFFPPHKRWAGRVIVRGEGQGRAGLLSSLLPLPSIQGRRRKSSGRNHAATSPFSFPPSPFFLVRGRTRDAAESGSSFSLFFPSLGPESDEKWKRRPGSAPLRPPPPPSPGTVAKRRGARVDHASQGFFSFPSPPFRR